MIVIFINTNAIINITNYDYNYDYELLLFK